MEETKVIEMQNQDEEAVKVKKESKVKTIIGKVGSGVKRHWKTIAVGVAAFGAGAMLVSKKSSTSTDDDDTDDDPEFESVDNEVNE